MGFFGSPNKYIENRVRMIFGFSLYTRSLLVTYFKREYGKLRGLEPLKCDKICYH